MKRLLKNDIITKFNIIQKQIDNENIAKSDIIQVYKVDSIITKCILQSR